MTQLRWGLLGTARINRALIPVLRESPLHLLQAVASRTLDRARAYAAEWKIPVARSGSYEALLGDPEIDVVYISLPNSLHAEWTVRALDAGKHVLCEKPLALTSARSIGSRTAAARASRRSRPKPSCTATIRSRRRPRRSSKRAARRVRGYEGAFTFTLTREGDVRLDPALGGGSLWDVGCYPLSYACFLAGAAPVEVFGWQRRSVRGVDIEFAGTCASPTAARAVRLGFHRRFAPRWKSSGPKAGPEWNTRSKADRTAGWS